MQRYIITCFRPLSPVLFVACCCSGDSRYGTACQTAIVIPATKVITRAGYFCRKGRSRTIRVTRYVTCIDSTAVRVQRYSILTWCLIKLRGISSLSCYGNNIRRPCVIKRKVLGICRCLSRSITAIFRSISVCYLIRLQSAAVTVFPCDVILALGLVVNCLIGLRAFNCRKL